MLALRSKMLWRVETQTQTIEVRLTLSIHASGSHAQSFAFSHYKVVGTWGSFLFFLLLFLTLF